MNPARSSPELQFLLCLFCPSNVIFAVLLRIRLSYKSYRQSVYPRAITSLPQDRKGKFILVLTIVLQIVPSLPYYHYPSLLFFFSGMLVQLVKVLLCRFKLEWAAWMVDSCGNLDHEVNYARMLPMSQTWGTFWEIPDSLAVSQEMSRCCESYLCPSFLTGKIK